MNMKINDNIWKTQKLVILATGILMAASACDEPQKQEHDEKLKEAFDVHTESVEIRSNVAEQIATIKQNQDSLFVANHQTQLDSLYSLVETWDDQLVEVPGYEHAHDHAGHDHSHDHHHHGHDHVENLNLTSAEHLEIQQHLKQEITSLKEAFSEISK